MKPISKIIFGSVFSLLCLCVPLLAIAGPFEDGLEAYNTKNYGDAARFWRTAARAGDAESQFNLGYMYENGQSFAPSTTQAIFWYVKAARQDHVAGINALKRLNINSETGEVKTVGVESISEPIRESIAEQKNVELAAVSSPPSLPQMSAPTDGFVSIDEFFATRSALESPEELYKSGLSAFKSEAFSKAVGYWRLASDQGHARSQDYLAHMYFTGKGVTKDYARAISWYKRAAIQDNIPSQKQLAILYDVGKFGVSKSDEQSAHWYEKAASLGDAASMYQMGQLYYDGKGVEKSEGTAVKWLQRAAKSGYAPALIRLKVLGVE